MSTMLANHFPDADMIDKMGAFIGKLVDQSGWEFSCEVPDKQGTLVKIPLKANLLSQPDQLMCMVLHRATRLFYDTYQAEPYVAYRHTEGATLEVLPEFEPGMATASLVNWCAVIYEAFDQLAQAPRAELALGNTLALDDWHREFQESLEGMEGSRPINLLKSHKALVLPTPDIILTPRRQSVRTGAAADRRVG